jgi:hypothetical protein
VLFGRKPAIASILRKTLFSPPKHLSSHIKDLSTTVTPPCYLILSSEDRVAVLEKDLLSTPVIRESDEFIVQTNNDSGGNDKNLKVNKTFLGVEASIEESEGRMKCMTNAWSSYAKERRTRIKETERIALRESTLRKWVKRRPTMNGLSHFATMMDPKKGEIRWLQRGHQYDSDLDSD